MTSRYIAVYEVEYTGTRKYNSVRCFPAKIRRDTFYVECMPKKQSSPPPPLPRTSFPAGRARQGGRRRGGHQPRHRQQQQLRGGLRSVQVGQGQGHRRRQGGRRGRRRGRLGNSCRHGQGAQTGLCGSMKNVCGRMFVDREGVLHWIWPSSAANWYPIQPTNSRCLGCLVCVVSKGTSRA